MKTPKFIKRWLHKCDLCKKMNFKQFTEAIMMRYKCVECGRQYGAN